MMSKGVHLLLLSLATIALVSSSATAADNPEEEAINARAMAFASAWNEHDAEEMAALWTEDGDFIDPFGRIARGRAEIEKLFAEDQSGMMKGSTYTMTLKWIHMLAPDLAIATWDGSVTGLTGPGGIVMPSLDHIVTAVTIKKDGSWWTVAARAMAPMDMASPAPAPGPQED